MVFYNPKLYLRDYWVGPVFLGSVLAQIVMWWYLLVNIHPTVEQIFLHYNSVFGIDLIGNWWQIFYLPAGGLLILVINFSMKDTTSNVVALIKFLLKANGPMDLLEENAKTKTFLKI